MLKYENIYAICDAEERLRRGYRWGAGHHSKDSDALLMFTIGPKADEDAAANLDFLLSLGQKHSATHLVLHANKIQYLANDANNGIEQDLLPAGWTQQYQEWLESKNLEFAVQDSGQGFCHSFRTWRRAFATRKTHGIYDLSTGVRLTNRQDIIQRIWNHGFASWRGRPLAVANIKWSGSREELEDLTVIADRYWSRRHKSDMAKKMCSAYTAINRYAAWPGAW
jgi:hypothetical protein